MRRAIAAIILGLWLLPDAGAGAEVNTVAFSILPGQFSVELSTDGDFVVVNIDDATGTSQGWWVTIDCTCELVPVSQVITLAGQKHEPDGGPRIAGRTILAKPRYGMGEYQVRFAATPGNLVLTYGRGTGVLSGYVQP